MATIALAGRKRPSNRQIRKLGIFGGAFNPIHLAHLRSAEEVGEALQLDRVLFVPTGTPTHKTHRDLAAARHRLAMVRRAIRGNPRFGVSTIELERAGDSYSIDTVREIHGRYPLARLYLIIGMDQYQELATWRDYQQLLKLCNLVVTSRPGYSFGPSSRSLPVAVRRDFCYRGAVGRFVHRTGTEIIFVRITDLDISASGVRHRVHRGTSVRYLVPASVHRYLVQHRLYRGRLSALGHS